MSLWRRIKERLGWPGHGEEPGSLGEEPGSSRGEGPPSEGQEEVRIEDILVRLEPLGVEALEPWRALALRGIGPDEERPADGAALVRAAP